MQRLNLIERFWKFIINECLDSKYYANFAVLAVAISNSIATANTDKEKKLNSLLNLEFQTFKKVQFLTVQSITLSRELLAQFFEVPIYD